jgi:hypothetical protein
MSGPSQAAKTALEMALELEAAGLSPVPVRPDGSKAPALPSWTEFQKRRATPDVIKGWFPDGSKRGVGVVTGEVSENLLMIELEGRAANCIPAIADLARETGQGALWAKVSSGWMELSPSGGLHFFVRTKGPTPGNQKIARDAEGQVLAETRGTGGFSIVAPSNGACHPSGKPWIRVTGGPSTTPLIDDDLLEDTLALIAAGLGNKQTPPTFRFNQPRQDAPAATGPLSPGDDYENKTDWADILIPAGWALVYTSGRTRHWRRPGKTSGISATTGRAEDRDRLFVFSSSTEFEHEVPYTKFGAYGLVNHGGDLSAAAKELRRQGFGSEPTGQPAKPTLEVAEPEPRRSLLESAFDAKWLMQQEFPPIRYVVKDLIPEGLGILAGPPKIAKSWLVLGIALDVSGGQPALGCIPTEQRPVFYAALEDGKRRLQNRLITLGATNPSPNLTFITTAPSGDIVHMIGEYLNAHAGEAPVIFLDTWGKAVRPAVSGETTYERDYKVAGGLKALADAHPGSSIIVVHHTRKAQPGDFIDAVSGTQGIAGAADTILVLRRGRGETTGTLSATSRDTSEGEYRVNLEGVGRWTLAGGSLAAAAAAEQTAKATAGVGDRMAEVIEAVGRHPEGISPRNLKALLTGMDPADVDTYLSRAWNASRIRKLKRGFYAPIPAFPEKTTQNPTL